MWLKLVQAGKTHFLLMVVSETLVATWCSSKLKQKSFELHEPLSLPDRDGDTKGMWTDAFGGHATCVGTECLNMWEEPFDGIPIFSRVNIYATVKKDMFDRLCLFHTWLWQTFSKKHIDKCFNLQEKKFWLFVNNNSKKKKNTLVVWKIVVQIFSPK